MHGEAGDLQSARMNRVQKGFRLCVTGEQRVRIAVVRAAEGTDADLDRLHTHAREVVERLLEGHGTKDDSKDADFHRMISEK